MYSFELEDNGAVKSVRALGREFAVWRGDDGRVSAFGAYCPHLGANLAIGGVVEDNCLKCPFHGWRFNQDGSARDSPGCGDTAPHGKAESYLCVERNHMIMIWLGAKRDALRRGRSVPGVDPREPEVPAWEVPQESLLKENTQFVGVVEHILAAHIQEIPENGADGAHLTTVHAPFVISSLSGWVDHDWLFTWTPGEGKLSHTAVVGMNLGMRVFGRLWDAMAVKVHVVQMGPALVHEVLSLPLGLGKIYFASSVTPVQPLLLRYTHAMWCSPYLPRIVAKTLLRGLQVQVDRDVPIWNNKTYRSKPYYTKADANIPPFRRWFKQFYSEHSETYEQAMAIEKGSMSLEW
jgi:cholesterol 7-dehydrogenase